MLNMTKFRPAISRTYSHLIVGGYEKAWGRGIILHDIGNVAGDRRWKRELGEFSTLEFH